MLTNDKVEEWLRFADVLNRRGGALERTPAPDAAMVGNIAETYEKPFCRLHRRTMDRRSM